MLVSGNYLSDIYTELPSNCLLNKGITGCGGTTVELKSNRNSIILCPTINLVLNKSDQTPLSLGVYGDIKESDILKYIQLPIYKKIIATYDALPKLIRTIGNSIFTDYFLLIDEYHILFNSYLFRYDAISFILNNFNRFKNFCFMTATPLTENTILTELKEIPKINLEWEKAVPVKVTVIDTRYIIKQLLIEINKCKDYNLHIFINSVKTINQIIKQLKPNSFRTVCSKEISLKNKLCNPVDINSPIKQINFYTSTAFEGVDIYDPIGKSIIISDSNISTTLFDISTLLIQICGRLRDSIYKDEILFIVNTNTHKYLKFINDNAFFNEVNKNITLGKEQETVFNNSTDLYREGAIKKYNIESDSLLYLVKENNKIKYSDNLKNIDCNNYKIVTKVFNSSINVLKEINNTSLLKTTSIEYTNDELLYLNNINTKQIYSYEELKLLLEETFNRLGINFNGLTLKNKLGRIYTKFVKCKDKKEITYYKFI